MTSHNHSLVLTARQVEQLRDHLLRDDGLERCAYAYCSPDGAGRFLCEELVLIPDEDMHSQSRMACRPAEEVELRLVQDCLRRGMHPVTIHSHPFDESVRPGFSAMDDTAMTRFRPFVTWHEPDAVPMYAVFSQEGVDSTVYPHGQEEREALPVTVIGNHRLDPPLGNAEDTVAPEMDAAYDEELYDRGIRALGAVGQQRLADTHIGIVGVGGIGNFEAVESAMYGVGELTLIDPDVVEKSNLPRLISATTHHIGRPKVEVVKEDIWRQNPDATVHTVQAPVEEAAEELREVDLIVAGLDRVSTRQWLNAFAVRHMKPYIDAGVVITTEENGDTEAPQVEKMEGNINTILPGATACLKCLKWGDPERARIERLSDEKIEEEIERGYIEETDLSPSEAVVPLNGVVASKTVQMVAKLVTGYAPPVDYLAFEGVGNTLEEVSTRPRPTCPTCGDDGMLGRGVREVTEAEVAAADYDLDLDASDIGLASADADEETGGEVVDVEVVPRTGTRYARIRDRVVDVVTAMLGRYLYP